MKVYVFGNKDVPEDAAAFVAAKNLQEKMPEITFIFVSPNEDLPFVDEEHVILLDVVQGIHEVLVIDEKQLDHLVTLRGTTVHDYDLGFQLRYLKKLGKIQKITIIGLPQERKIDYDTIQSILRKFVVQDMQGS